MFNDNTGIPSHQTMPGYNLLNASLSFKIPFPHYVAGSPKVADIKLTVLNLLNKQYDGYEDFSSGGYYGPNTNSVGAILAYPGMPISAYATLTLKF
ncbi:MAG: TonB-dependent receptor [Candidatus Acididesulfobacter guangdongensis]|uniref:TonB-dependent receptor n=1 Tax=Acididesulfobacter guangdongensis TaxID=2597225 RepID=A0A519BJ40_ACIG2|nr:MAG: TonB-dependent receptor [Candidatus Acididesulfobacter guangdongensis]